MPSPNSLADTANPDSPRAEFQKGLLAWLKAPQETASLDVMLHALATAQREVTQAGLPEMATCLAAAEALFVAIRDKRLEALVPYRRLAARVEQTLRKGVPDAELLADLQAPLLQFDPPPQAPIEALQPRDPLATSLESTAAILPLLSTPREPRFTTAQRSLWDNAVEAMGIAWAKCNGTPTPEGWVQLRQGIFRLLDGALALSHPDPLRLAEALAAATDELESTPPSPRLLTALAASMELLQEQDFLEHDALESLVQQLVTRLERRDEGPRSRHLDSQFADEAEEEIEQLRLALETLPPDCETLADAARRIQQLAEPLDLAPLALVAFRFAQCVERIAPEQLDRSPGRDIALEWIDALESWITAIGEATPPPPPTKISGLQTQLSALLENDA